jgi:rhamnose transport system substrate-binding protein
MLWNPIDFGYVSAYVAYALVNGDTTGATGDIISVGTQGERDVMEGGVVNLGPLFKFTADNVDDFNF